MLQDIGWKEEKEVLLEGRTKPINRDPTDILSIHSICNVQLQSI